MKFFVNLLTTSRIPLILFVVIINLMYNAKESMFWFWASIIVMSLVGITDFLDGYLARKYNATSKFGAHADPLTDKIFFLATFPMLVYLSCLSSTKIHSIILVILAISYSVRDQIVTFFRTIGSEHNIDAKATWYGKLRTAISFPAIIFIYYYIQFPVEKMSKFLSADIINIIKLNAPIIYSLEIVLFLLTSITLVMYAIKYYPAIKAEIE